jgi:hypothetical protein
MASNHSTDGKVFVQFFPTKRIAVKFELNPSKVVLGCLAKYLIAISGKADDSTVR